MYKSLIPLSDKLEAESKNLLQATPLLKLLRKLGEPIQTGSSLTGLMAYPDIDFTVQNENPDVGKAIGMLPEIFSQLKATAIKLDDFGGEPEESASYYLGIELLFSGRKWHIDATITKTGPIVTNPPELAGWIANMTPHQREIILRLKKELIDAHRYAGARSQPPYTFRSRHLYEAVLVGNAKTIKDLENYFKK